MPLKKDIPLNCEPINGLLCKFLSENMFSWRRNERCFSDCKCHLWTHTLQELIDRLWIKRIFFAFLFPQLLPVLLLQLVLDFNIQNLTSKHASFFYPQELVVVTLSNNWRQWPFLNPFGGLFCGQREFSCGNPTESGSMSLPDRDGENRGCWPPTQIHITNLLGQYPRLNISNILLKIKKHSITAQFLWRKHFKLNTHKLPPRFNMQFIQCCDQIKPALAQAHYAQKIYNQRTVIKQNSIQANYLTLAFVTQARATTLSDWGEIMKNSWFINVTRETNKRNSGIEVPRFKQIKLQCSLHKN